jgi:predicted GNAT family acetyltransferase
VKVERFASVAAFSRRAVPYLARNEATHCLQIGICGVLRGLTPEQLAAAAPPIYLALVTDDNDLQAVALRTPPHNVVLSLVADPARVEAVATALADDLRALYGAALSGAIGPQRECAAFAQAWQRATGRTARVAMRERIYQLETVIPVPDVPGALRRATEADRPLMEAWLTAFAAEAMANGEQMDAAGWVTNALTTPTRGALLWEDAGRPVALVGYGNPTPHGIRIGPVYTPPELRGRGYASAATAAVSQQLLDEGRQFCFLFTDLSNPTSNSIYQKIGYRPVIDVDMYAFDTEEQ